MVDRSSAAKEKLKSKFNKGCLVEAKDFANVWYKSKVVEFDEVNLRAKVHFLGWNSRYDQWFDINGGHVRPIKDTSPAVAAAQPEKPTPKHKSKKKDASLNPAPVDNNNIDLIENQSLRFKIGANILAKWKDDCFYPATVCRHVIKGTVFYYEVKFFDGIKKLVRFCNAKESTEDEPQLLDACSKLKQSNELEDEARRAEAELLLAISKPNLLENSPIDEDLEQKNIKHCLPAETVKTETTEKDGLVATKPEALESSNLRKSSRVKRLKTFKDEIVFYSPSCTKNYNMPAETATQLTQTESFMRTTGRKTSVSSSMPVNKPEATRIGNKLETKTVSRRYFQSLKSMSSNKPKRLLNLAKFDQKKSLRIKQRKAELASHESEGRKKERKDLLKQLIESSQLQLKKQQELIEKQLSKHRQQKMKRKMLRLLKRKQRLENEREVMSTSQQPLDVPPLNSIEEEEVFDCLQAASSKDGDDNSLSRIEPIRCNFSNCDKLFRKQSLLEYHLKYHHYVDVKSFTTSDFEKIILSTPNLIEEAKLNRKIQIDPSQANDSSGLGAVNQTLANTCHTEQVFDDDFNWNEIGYTENDEDPYDIVHCECGDHTTNGFMIQCEICLCWQHGECVNVKSVENVPAHHSCWICNDPDNRLKKLKYQSWMQIQNENMSESTLQQEDKEKLTLLNKCSRKYFNLNLLMLTIEYQQSLLSKLTKSQESATTTASQQNSSSNLELNNQIEKLLMNIAHLQDCAATKFEDFNKHLDDFETNYQQNNKNSLPRFFNLQELYKQLQSFVCN